MLIDIKKIFFFFKLGLLMSLFVLVNNCTTKGTAEIHKDISHEKIEVNKTYNLVLIRFERNEILLFQKKFINKKNIENFKTISSNMSSKNFAFESGIGLSNIEEYITEIFQSIKSTNVNNLRIDMSSSTIIIERLG
jgi:hypothetical protein